MNAAVAARPPIIMVCVALRRRPVPVKLPFIYPKIPNAANVTIAETVNPCEALESTKYGDYGIIPPAM